MPKKRPELRGNSNKKNNNNKPEPAPIPAKEEGQSVQEDGEHSENEFKEESYFFYLSHYCNQATKDYNRHYFSVKNNNPKAWILAWYDGMKEELQDYNIEERAFINDWLNVMNFDSAKTFSDDIKYLQNFFDAINLPSGPVKLSPGNTINDCRKFIYSHMETLKANDGVETFRPYLDRLYELRTILLK